MPGNGSSSFNTSELPKSDVLFTSNQILLAIPDLMQVKIWLFYSKVFDVDPKFTNLSLAKRLLRFTAENNGLRFTRLSLEQSISLPCSTSFIG